MKKLLTVLLVLWSIGVHANYTYGHSWIIVRTSFNATDSVQVGSVQWFKLVQGQASSYTASPGRISLDDSIGNSALEIYFYEDTIRSYWDTVTIHFKIPKIAKNIKGVSLDNDYKAMLIAHHTITGITTVTGTTSGVNTITGTTSGTNTSTGTTTGITTVTGTITGITTTTGITTLTGSNTLTGNNTTLGITTTTGHKTVTGINDPIEDKILYSKFYDEYGNEKEPIGFYIRRDYYRDRISTHKFYTE